MSAEDRNGEVSTDEKCTDCTSQERSFDALARGLANGGISRRRALRLLGGALLGGAVASIPGVGWLAGDSGEARAAPGDGPGGSDCGNSGASCTAQQCCGGYTCLLDDTSGTDKFCCPELLVCGSRCCPVGAECRPGGQCACPLGKTLCPADADDTGLITIVGQCVDTMTDLQNCGGCGKPCTTNDTCGKAVCVGGQCQVIPDPAKFGSVCREAQDECDLPATCNSTSTQCPDNPFRPETFVCRAAGGDCEGVAFCSGNSAQCPPNPFLSTTVVCREAQDECDLPATCTGQSAQCPPNPFRPETFPCRAAGGDCEGVAFCSGNSAQCPPNPFLDTGTPCETGNRCTADFCEEGVCQQGPETVTCPQCEICNPETGTCRANPAANGTPCENGDLCTTGDTCLNGTCQPGRVTTCPDTGNQCTVSVCNSSTGICEIQNRTGSCNDGNPCTENDRCQNGLCAGDPIAGCVRCNTASDCPTTQCQQAACTGGVCVVTNRTGSCNDGNPCTTNDQCQNGVCTGTAVTCPSGQICCPAGSPGTIAGTCRRASGISCNNNNQCCSNSCPGMGTNRTCA